jgi:hypothetical protein
MTDTAAVAATTDPSPPPQTEVPINENPTNAPAPIGPQAPPADERKAAIQRAFDRANNPQAKGTERTREAPKPAEARSGHNKPPEETKPEPIDLKKRPQELPRGDRGQFAPRQAADPGNTRQNAAVPGVAQQDGKQQAAQRSRLPENAPYRMPPPRMAEHAKRDWDTAPESVRGEVYRMHQEFDRAYQQYRGAAEAFQPVAKYHQMAQQHGTTLDRALHNYTSMEQKLRADPIGGLDVIVNNLGLQSPDGQRITLRDVAYHVLSQSPEALKQVQQGNAVTAQSQQLGALHQEIAGLKNHLHQMHNAQKFNYTRSAVDQFAVSHPRFDELGKLIEYELRLGFDLETAYRRAELLYPASHADQTRTTTPSAQTRTKDRSISGAPDVTPSNGASPRKGPPPSRREAIQNAIRRVNGSM